MSWNRFDAAVFIEKSTKDSASSLARELVKKLREFLPVFIVAVGGEGRVAASAKDDESFRFLTLNESDPTKQGAALSALLRGQNIQRPLVVLSEPSLAEACLAVFAPLRALLLTGGDASTALPPARIMRCFDVVLTQDAAAPRIRHRNTASVAESAPLDAKVNRWIEALSEGRREMTDEDSRYEVLVLYDAHAIHVGTTLEHLESFALHSRHRFWYANAALDGVCRFDLDWFDAVVVHYSCRVCYPHLISSSFFERLKTFGGLKVLFIQDDYDHTHNTHAFIAGLGIQVVFTCVPRESVDLVYPRAKFPHVRFLETMTGYVSRHLEEVDSPATIAQRRWLIGYRGRESGYWYGALGQEKITIARRMREECDRRGLATNIEWTEQKRLYGAAWHQFIRDCRATLGTESGSNLFDWDGSLREAVLDALARNPNLTYEEIYEPLLKAHDNVIRMNQISPRIFEAIALRTALVLFEGTYSGLIQPDVHFISLRKDFSNVDDVLARLKDDAYLEQMTRRAYDEVVASRRYNYESFVRGVDEVLESELGTTSGRRLIPSVTGATHKGHADTARRADLASAPLTAVIGAHPLALPEMDAIFSSKAPRWVRGLRRLGRRFIPQSIRRRLKRPLRAVALRIFSLPLLRRLRGK